MLEAQSLHSEASEDITQLEFVARDNGQAGLGLNPELFWQDQTGGFVVGFFPPLFDPFAGRLQYFSTGQAVPFLLLIDTTVRWQQVPQISAWP